MSTDIESLRTLVGSKIPKGGVPAAWWITTDESQIAAYDRWAADYEQHIDQVKRLAESIGVDVDSARVSSFGGRTNLSGFNAPRQMLFGEHHPDHIPVPAGWRVDSKKDRLVPSRKTKVDRESQANKDFAALQRIPDVGSYMSGLPTEIYLDDRDFGGTVYGIQYRRAELCVMAFSGGDPDRQPPDTRRDEIQIDSTVWERQPLSSLLLLREGVAA